MDKHLNGKDFLVWGKLTVADVDMWANLRYFFMLLFVDQQRKTLFPNVDRWFQKLMVHEQFVGVFGSTLLCKVVQKAPKVEKKVEEKKADPVKVEKKAEKEEEWDDDEQPKEKKKTYNFPESKLDFDQFKKDFMNSQDRKSVLQKLWTEQYDPNAFSIYKIRYQKLSSEWKELWKTENSRWMFI